MRSNFENVEDTIVQTEHGEEVTASMTGGSQGSLAPCGVDCICEVVVGAGE